MRVVGSQTGQTGLSQPKKKKPSLKPVVKSGGAKGAVGAKTSAPTPKQKISVAKGKVATKAVKTDEMAQGHKTLEDLVKAYKAPAEGQIKASEIMRTLSRLHGDDVALDRVGSYMKRHPGVLLNDLAKAQW